MSFNSNYKYIALSLVLILASISFVRTSVSILQSKKRVEVIKEEVAELENKKVFLQEELEFQKSPEFIELEARNKLNMIKPTEEVFVVDEDLSREIDKNYALSSSLQADKLMSEQRQNLYQWLKLLL